jgi:hypothetical protein
MRIRGIAAAALIAFAACGGAKPAPRATGPTPAPRIASTATVKILEPASDASVPAGTVHVRIELAGGQISPQTSTDLKPDVGHLHLKMDGQLVSMNYSTDSDITAKAGQHLLEAEFVALDHGPFNPRVVSSTTFTAT